MSYPDLPAQIKEMTAAPEMRWRHRYWHLVKNPGFVNDPVNAQLVQALANIGWTAPLTGQPGAGLDFLYMHRMMINNVDTMLSTANDHNWPKVVGWTEIPPDGDDNDWPEPEIENLDDPTRWPPDLSDTFAAIANARSADVVSQNLEYEVILRDPEFLKRDDITLDVYGDLIENTVHNWMHMRFAAHPPEDFNDPSVSNDWLGAPFSSHVNPYFWKLHGWIDDCIGHWEAANDEVADFSTAWRPPTVAPPWDQLDLGMGLLSLAEVGTRPRSPLFGTIKPFQTSQDALERAEHLLHH